MFMSEAGCEHEAERKKTERNQREKGGEREGLGWGNAQKWRQEKKKRKKERVMGGTAATNKAALVHRERKRKREMGGMQRSH